MKPGAVPRCPRRRADHVVRNIPTRAGSVNLPCRRCGRRFVPRPERPPVTPETEALVRRPPPERRSRRAVARSAGVSRAWNHAGALGYLVRPDNACPL